jgi:hypothetical protein
MRNHCLAGNDRRGGGEDHQRQSQPERRQKEERIVQRVRVAQDQCPLAEVIQDQAGQHEESPGPLDRSTPEMAHIRIEGLGAGHGEHDRAQGDEGHQAMMGREDHDIAGGQGPQDRWVMNDLRDAEQADRQEEHRHDRTEDAADGRGAAILEGKQQADHQHRQRQHGGLEDRRGDFQTLHRREY